MLPVPRSRPLLFGLVAAATVFTDIYSKHRVFDALGYPGGRSPWTKAWFDGSVRFELYTSFNEGALWGMGQGLSWLFALMSVGAAVAVVYWLFVLGAARSWWLTLALALVTGGALGNLWDRLGLHGCTYPDGEGVRHAVRDFLLFRFDLFGDGTWSWPVFNFADVYLVTGATMLALQSLRPLPATGEDGGRVHVEEEPAAPEPLRVERAA